MEPNLGFKNFFDESYFKEKFAMTVILMILKRDRGRRVTNFSKRIERPRASLLK
jgi:hypothetical protein